MEASILLRIAIAGDEAGMSDLFTVAAVVIVLSLAATAYIAVKAGMEPLPRVLRFALELAVFVVGIIVLDSAVAGFHLDITPIGRNEGAVILAGYALLTVLPALRRLHEKKHHS